jgi:3-dehydroquinate dehydratase type I
MNKPDYCLPIIESDKSSVLEAIRTNLDDYKYFEVWLDYVEGTDQAFLNDLVRLLGDRLIVTFRRQQLENPVMEPAVRLELLKTLSGTPVLVDLDIGTQKAELEQADGLQLIVSYHNYDETPDTLQLEAIIDTMEPYRPAVYKLSTLCRTEEDAVRLLQILLSLKRKNARVVVSGMGESGLATRVFGPLWGSQMAFAPLEAENRSAPGQLTRAQLETIYKELNQ